jgi:hypothetical protein
MPRIFNDTDRTKKKDRIILPENVAGLSTEQLKQLESKVRDSLVKGYLPCARAFKIAAESGVPVAAVGQAVDKIGHRITGCQLGCFKVEKTLRDNIQAEQVDKKIVEEVIALDSRGELTCAAIFELARRYHVKPLAVADAANLKHLKIHNCQLGCFS